MKPVQAPPLANARGQQRRAVEEILERQLAPGLRKHLPRQPNYLVELVRRERVDRPQVLPVVIEEPQVIDVAAAVEDVDTFGGRNDDRRGLARAVSRPRDLKGRTLPRIPE